MKIYPTNDLELIEKTMKHPSVFSKITDDQSAAHPEEWKPELDDEVTYLAVKEESIFLGIFVIVSKGDICSDIHSCLLPAAYGEKAIEALSAAIRWVWINTPCRRLIASIPDDNPLAYKLAKNVGMEDFGVNPNCIMRGGRLRSMKLVGISKGVDS